MADTALFATRSFQLNSSVSLHPSLKVEEGTKRIEYLNLDNFASGCKGSMPRISESANEISEGSSSEVHNSAKGGSFYNAEEESLMNELMDDDAQQTKPFGFSSPSQLLTHESIETELEHMVQQLSVSDEQQSRSLPSTNVQVLRSPNTKSVLSLVSNMLNVRGSCKIHAAMDSPES